MVITLKAAFQLSGAVPHSDDVDMLGDAVDTAPENAGHVCAMTEAVGVDAIAHEVGAPLSAALEFHVSDQHTTINYQFRSVS